MFKQVHECDYCAKQVDWIDKIGIPDKWRRIFILDQKDDGEPFQKPTVIVICGEHNEESIAKIIITALN